MGVFLLPVSFLWLDSSKDVEHTGSCLMGVV